MDTSGAIFRELPKKRLQMCGKTCRRGVWIVLKVGEYERQDAQVCNRKIKQSSRLEILIQVTL